MQHLCNYRPKERTFIHWCTWKLHSIPHLWKLRDPIQLHAHCGFGNTSQKIVCLECSLGVKRSKYLYNVSYVPTHLSVLSLRLTWEEYWRLPSSAFQKCQLKLNSFINEGWAHEATSNWCTPPSSTDWCQVVETTTECQLSYKCLAL